MAISADFKDNPISSLSPLQEKMGLSQMGLSINGGIPKWMVDDGSLQRQLMENPIDMDDLGVPSILGNFHIFLAHSNSRSEHFTNSTCEAGCFSRLKPATHIYVNQSQEMCAFCFIPTGATQSSWHQQYNHSVQEDLWIPCTLWLFNI